jgi:hypothetical protein
MKLWVAPESNKILTGVSLIENVPVSIEAPSGMSLMVVKFNLPWQTCTMGFLARIGRLGPCTLILWVGLVLPGLRAVIEIMPRLSTIVTTTFTGDTWGCVRLGSLLLSVVELEVP